jgi:hypothetical protein
LKQRIDISHVSGMSNVKFWLQEHGYDAANDALCQHLFGLAKTTSRVLLEDELHAACIAFAGSADARSSSPEASP